ncbi:SpoIIE family protein phosphatase [Streptomyces seoulensis]
MTSNNGCEARFGGHGAAQTDAAVAEALRDAVLSTLPRCGAIGAAAYLVDAEQMCLRVAAIAGSPPSFFAFAPQADLKARCAVSQALPLDTAVTDPGSAAEARGWDDSLSAAYRMIEAPVVSGQRRFGTLVILRVDTEAERSDTHLTELRRAGAELAEALAELGDGGRTITAASAPMVFPALLASPHTPGWGRPDVPGSSGASMLYPLHHLSGLLNLATTMDEIVAAARSCVMAPFRAQAVVLAVAREGRFWVVGHGGASSEPARNLHGSRLDAPSAAADALREGPQFRGAAKAGPARLERVPRPELSEVHFPLTGRRQVFDLPLTGASDVLGVCCLFFEGERGFPPEERAVLQMMAALLGPALERVELSSQQRRLAEQLQRRLLPARLPELPRLTVAARYRPASVTSEVGGDWYDVISTQKDRVVLVVGDVEGHDMTSAAVMGQVRTALASYAVEGHRPAAVIDRTGRLLARLGADLLVTCCVIALDTCDGTAEVALAGHPEPVVRHPDGSTSALSAPANLPLGVSAHHVYQGREHTIAPGSVLLLHSDGLSGTTTDARRWARELFDGVGPAGAADLEQLADHLMAESVTTRQRGDDAVLLVARYEAAMGTRPPRTAGLHVQRRDLPGAAAARRFVDARLRSWGLAGMSDALQLVASELVTNALIHAGSDVDVRLRAFADRVRLEVRDSDSDPPIPSAFDEEENAKAESGRGLLIVEALAGDWNTSPNGRGKTVSVEMPVPGGDEA